MILPISVLELPEVGPADEMKAAGVSVQISWKLWIQWISLGQSV